MLTKLAVRNVKRSVRDYVLYAITLTLIIALMFAFNCMICSDLILGMNSHLDEYRSLLVLFSIVVLIVVAWLINYMTRFMLKKRSREFGTYLILGMESSDVSKMFLYENVILGVLSLGVGVILGQFAFQGLMAIVTIFFGKDFATDVSFDFGAVLLTILYYGAIQCLVVIRNNLYLRKLRIYDLINAAKMNESVKVGHVTRNVLIFILAFIVGALSLTKVPILVTVISIIFFIYGFYVGLSGVLVLMIDKTKRFKFRGMNLFIFRQLASKINTMGFTMGTIAVLFTLALLSGNYAVGLGEYKEEICKYVPFDACVTNLDADEDFTKLREMLCAEGWSEDEIAYKIYRGESDKFTNVLRENEISGGYFRNDCYLKVSDYNVLRGFLGLEQIPLEDHEFLVHCVKTVSDVYENYVKNNSHLAIGGSDYVCKGVWSEDFAQNGQNGAGFIIVVPDAAADALPVYYSQYACTTAKEPNDELYRKILEYVPQDAEKWATSAKAATELDHGMGIDSAYVIFDNVCVKNGGIAAEVTAAIVTIVVSIFYVALVLVCVALTILAVQQLSDSAQYQFRYRVLDRLGVGRSERARLVFRQLLIYFGCPIVIPVMISLIVSMKINALLMTGTQIQGSSHSFFMVAMAFFFAVYVVYFAATYFGFRRNVENDRT